MNGESITAMFNLNDSTLTLNGMTLEGTSIHDSGIISRLEKLTIYIEGSNTITTASDSCTAIRADMEGAQTLIIKKGSDDCSFVLNASHAIHDFNTLTLNGLFWNDRFTYRFDETISGYPSGYRLMLSDGVEAKKDTDFNPTLSDTDEYGIIVTTDDTGPISVTNKNRMNVLNDVETAATVQFDGVNTLILNNANLQKIDIKERPTFAASGLTIFLKGTNVIDNDGIDSDGRAAIVNADFTSNFPLAFSTSEVNGGQLTCSYEDYSLLFPDIKDNYKNYLLLTQDDDNHQVIISQQIQSLVNETTKEVILDGCGEGLGKDIKGKSTEELAAGVVVNKIFYLLGEDDGCAEDENVVCLNSYISDGEVNVINDKVLNGEYIPGTSDFANDSGFKGLIFLLPAGSGKIIIEYNSFEKGSLAVMIGKNFFRALYTDNNMETVEIPYVLTSPCYVYIYALAFNDPSRKYEAHRAPGIKTETTVAIRSIGVRADNVGSAPLPPLNPKRLTKADVQALIEARGGLKYGDELTINDADYTSIDDDALESSDPHERLKVPYLDLSQTSITGLTVDRYEFPFQNLDDGAFVYLPYGNDIEDYRPSVKVDNVVIGDVCPYVLLPDNDHPFKLAKNFKAGYTQLCREFIPEEYSTVYLPFDATDEMLHDNKFYQIKSVEGNTITMEVVKEPKANVPYMINPISSPLYTDQIVEFKKEIPEPTAVNGLTFVGTYETKNIVSSDTEDVFCFIEEGNFVRVKNKPITVNPLRGYMTMPKSSGSQSFNIIWGDDTTGLKEVTSKISDVRGDIFFDLQGHQVTNPTKGIYIQNGKKIVFNR